MMRWGVSWLAGVGRILMILCSFVTDIVYCPPPSNFNLGLDKWLMYLWPAIRNAVSASKKVCIGHVGWDLNALGDNDSSCFSGT